MFTFLERINLTSLFEQWCDENNLITCGYNMLVFLQSNELINEEKCKEYLKDRRVE